MNSTDRKTCAIPTADRNIIYLPTLDRFSCSKSHLLFKMAFEKIGPYPSRCRFIFLNLFIYCRGLFEKYYYVIGFVDFFWYLDMSWSAKSNSERYHGNIGMIPEKVIMLKQCINNSMCPKGSYIGPCTPKNCILYITEIGGILVLGICIWYINPQSEYFGILLSIET